MPTTLDLDTILAAADRRTLAAVVTHLSGDPNAVVDLRDRAHIERLAAEVLPAYLDGTRTVTPPSDEVLQAAMNLAAGEVVPPEYGPLAREQMGLGTPEVLAPLTPPPGFTVLIIGAGVTGVLAAMTLDRLGLHDYIVVDKNPQPGGTWWQNSYPGCRVDTPSLLYSYSFDPDPGWPEHFSHQPELLGYVKGVVANSTIGDRLRCGVSVETMTWDTGAKAWTVGLAAADGTTETYRASAVIAATGLLRVARWPEIAGMETFAGPTTHSTHWDHSIDLTGKRVAVIGTGASANQIVPAIAPEAAEVIVYQRTPHWVLAHPQYGKALEGIELELFELPAYRSWNRFRQFWVFGDSILPAIKIDPEWPYPERAVNEANDKFRAQLTEYIASELGDRTDLLEKVLPTYPPYGKRMLVDNGWYKALRRDDVRLVTSPIRSIDATGIVTGDGHEDVDVIVYATGFHADKVMWPIQINGRDGVDVRARLDERPEAYRGIALDACPNLFISPGPNGFPGHGGNGMFFAEYLVRYVVECLRGMFERGAATMEVRPDVLRANVDAEREKLKDYVFSLPDVSNWFRSGRDEVVTVVAKRLVDLWLESRNPDFDAYTMA